MPTPEQEHQPTGPHARRSDQEIGGPVADERAPTTTTAAEQRVLNLQQAAGNAAVSASVQRHRLDPADADE